MPDYLKDPNITEKQFLNEGTENTFQKTYWILTGLAGKRTEENTI